jgi:flagellar M-ring protein FliF
MENFINSIQAFWKELGLNQKVSLSIAVLAVVAAMVGLWAWSSHPAMGLLYGRIDPKSMSEIVETLEDHGVPYRLENGGTSIFVPKHEIAKMRMQMATRGIPNGGGVGFEIFDRTSFGISDFIQRTNYMRAMQGEIARTISQMEGIRSARVMIALPEGRLLVTNQKAKATASIFIETSAQRLDKEAVNAIRFFVANAVDSLLVDDVTIVDQRGNVLTADMQEDPLVGVASSQFRFRQAMENYFTQKIETMLSKVVGPGNVVARVAVDVDMESVTKRSQTYDPEGQVVRTQTQTEDSHSASETRAAAAAGAGVGANAPQPGAGGPNNTTTDLRKNRTTSYEINQSTTEVVKTPGDIKKISAAVFVSQLLDADGKPLTRSPDQLERLKQMVVHSLGSSVVVDPEAVTLEEVPFVSEKHIDVAPEVSIMEQVPAWMESIKTFAALVLGAICAFLFYRMLRKMQSQSVAIEVLEEKTPVAAVKAPVAPITPELLTAMIQEDPLGASVSLKDWAKEGATVPK